MNLKFYFMIFQDALELCNFLRNRHGKHKVVMFYWTLVNMCPKLRIRLSAIKLLANAEKDKLNIYGFDAVVKLFFLMIKRS